MKVYMVEWGDHSTTVHASSSAAMEEHVDRPMWERSWVESSGVEMEVFDVPEGAEWTDAALEAIGEN